MMNLNTSNPAPLTPNIALIGAGAVVTKDVPDHALMVGNPARQIGWMCECGERLPENLKCAICGKALTLR